MKILFLGPEQDSQIKIINFLEKDKNEVFRFENKINIENLKTEYDILISYGYRYLIKKDLIEKFSYKCYNLHISYLPWNKGADPNFWSFAENTPKGVSIHLINEKIDDGSVLFRRHIDYNFEDTLFTT